MISEKIERLLYKEAETVKTLQFAMHLPSQGVNYTYSSSGQLDQRFHSASVGKLLTATLVFMAIEEGKISLDTRVQSVLGKERLTGLYVIDGQDYRGQVTVGHLLGHTSGINDYYAWDGESTFVDKIIKYPTVFWRPDDLLDYTREHQKPVGRPGQKFFYSDTGYVLLGLLVEAIFGAPFHQLLGERIFTPCQMTETTMAFYGEGFDAERLAPLYLNGTDIHLFRSLSCDFSGGGLSTTAGDLIKFLTCLYQRELLSQESLKQMANFKHRYRQGLHYGLGMMEVRFKEFFFLLKGLANLQGHWGVTGVHACYNPLTGDSFALNVGNSADMARSFRLLIKILQLINSEK